MDRGIGSVLRKARMRAEIELSEVETATRIRARFLRAIENEEWDVLPGGVYTRGFIRTYASFLGLDGERLVADYRRDVESSPQEEEVSTALASATTASPVQQRTHSYLRRLAAPAVLLVAVLAVIAIPSGSEDERAPRQSAGPTQQSRAAASPPPVGTASPPEGVSMRLSTTAEVWVCLLDATGEPLVAGQILEAGAEEGPFRSGSFTVSFGNGEVSMLIDGKQAKIPATPSPIGYSIDSSGRLTELGEGERPTCT